jgi:carboxyl-terminal processing protease
MKKVNVIIAIFLVFLIITPNTDYGPILQADENEYYKKVTRGLEYFEKVYKRVQSHYVEEIDPYEFVKAGIEGMLNTLDPYTVFIEQEGDARLQIITTGKYGGLGMEIGLRNNQVTVISPMDNSPAEKAGIRAGDIISEINGQPVSPLSPDKISRRLRGPVGTEVELTIKRPGFAHEITMKIKRAEIIIEDVSYSDFVRPGVVYIRLTGFTEKAATELIRAYNELKRQQEIKAFILDLRGNSGGLLESAVEVAGIFLPKGTNVVRTKGFSDGEHSFSTQSSPLLLETPLAVLVDGGTASASEIVAGALQDLDRAIIIGTKTFGKGLVQKVYNIDKNSSTKVKVTTAKYYIPSGRCVQKQDYLDNKLMFYNSLKDTSNKIEEHSAFYTTNRRTVFEHGGITPDKIVMNEEAGFVATELWRQSMLFNFAVKYHREHSILTGKLEISDKMFNDFIDFIRSKDFDYNIEGESELKKFLQTAREKNLPNNIISNTEQLLTQIKGLKEKALMEEREQISRMLLDELAEKYYGSKEKIKYSFRSDQQLHTAIDVLLNSSEYKKILAIN